MARSSNRPGSSRFRRRPVLHSSAGPTKVLSVANRQSFTEQLSQLLADQTRIRLVGGAHDRVQAAERLVLLKPDVVVIEADLDYELGGIDTAFALRSISPSTAFVLVSPYSDPERLAMVPRGLGLEWSYLLSRDEINKQDLVSAISSAAWSIPFIDRRVDRSLLGALQSRVEKAVDNVLRDAKRSQQRRKDSKDRGPGYVDPEEWDGKVQWLKLPEEDSDAEPDPGA